MENYNTNPRCRDAVEPRKPITPGLMFSATLVGNILALVLLHVRRRRTSPSLYKVLVTALLMTDLLGSISVSPVVLSAYAQNKSLLEMGTDNKVCSYFGFSMTFLSLSTLAMLCVMALERYVSIGHPYFYGRHLSKRCGYITIAFIYLSSILFCIIPFMGQGKYKQYAPGTWCFLDMATKDFRLYIGFYASFILIIITTTVVCNVYVIFLLVSMYRRGKVRRRGVSARPRCHRSLSMTEEVEHLLPLAIITVVFICCTFPLVLQVYINLTSDGDCHKDDLRALHLLSFHSILNPWVFIILRPSVLKIVWRKLRRRQKSPFIWGQTQNAQSKQTGGRPCCAVPETGK
ncbi:prostaglandin E receptor 2b subtype EP2 isoform X1 [Xiphias gladius]|uniref:prostaglandin E receptor 2b subtype EP2 isoform X1 n=1 Tax=Xiphias gladius TaxID=8245 RepID=UPI001A98457C|nr:prostaglandin E receptor 2b subtype EP2 isoform X1 [Xiphias gladius]